MRYRQFTSIYNIYIYTVFQHISTVYPCYIHFDIHKTESSYENPPPFCPPGSECVSKQPEVPEVRRPNLRGISQHELVAGTRHSRTIVWTSGPLTFRTEHLYINICWSEFWNTIYWWSIRHFSFAMFDYQRALIILFLLIYNYLYRFKRWTCVPHPWELQH